MKKYFQLRICKGCDEQRMVNINGYCRKCDDIKTNYLLRRNGKYLSDFYQWGDTPNTFAECYFADVLDEAMQYKDRPLEVGEVIGGDVDNAIWTKLD